MPIIFHFKAVEISRKIVSITNTNILLAIYASQCKKIQVPIIFHFNGVEISQNQVMPTKFPHRCVTLRVTYLKKLQINSSALF